MLLEVKDMHISYNGTKAVNGISADIPQGRSVAVIGPNGSGKSTFLKGLAGVMPLSSGKVFFDGEDITELSPRERLKRSILYLPQGIDVFPSLTVEDNIKLFLSEIPNTSSLDEAYSFYKPLWEKRKKLAGNLSGGERRLLAITRAFMAKPKLLLLDEPSAGIAPAMLDVIVKKIEDILNGETTLILVEQILPIAKRLADFFYILNNGSLYMSFPKEGFDDQKNRVREVFMGKNLATFVEVI